MQTLQKPSFEALSKHFAQWQKVGDLIDQSIDLMLNLRQSGHPGGSRSKVPLLVSTTLGGIMRWDLRHPEAPFGDRFVLVAGHCCPLMPHWLSSTRCFAPGRNAIRIPPSPSPMTAAGR
jgi:transketolase N-terminal domain/subunit